MKFGLSQGHSNIQICVDKNAYIVLIKYMKFGRSQGHSNIQMCVDKNAYIVLIKYINLNNRLEISPILLCRPYPQFYIHFFNPDVKTL